MKLSINIKLVLIGIILIAIPSIILGIVGYQAAKTAVSTGIEEPVQNQASQISFDVNTVYEIAQGKVESDLALARSIFYSYGKASIDKDGNMILVDSEKEADVARKVKSDLIVAHAIVYDNGYPTIDNSNMISVDATNQITKKKNRKKIPSMKIGSSYIAFNYQLVDKITKTSGVQTATIFQVIPEGLLRISTNVMKLDGKRAVGTYIPVDSPVYKTVMAKKTFFGRAFVVNAWYQTAYEPIIEKGKVIGVLYVGVKESKHIVNNNFEIVDKIKSLAGGTATIFQLKDFEGDTGQQTTKDWKEKKAQYRISTNVLMRNGKRAIGTIVSKPVFDKINAGEPFYGRAFVVNDWYLTAYEPIRDSETTEIIGILYVGVKEKDFQEKILKNLAKQRIKGSGYIWVINSEGEYLMSENGKILNGNILNVKSEDGKFPIKDVIAKAKKLPIGGSTSHQFVWKDRSNISGIGYMKDWDWIILVTAFYDDIAKSDELSTVRAILILVIILATAIGGGVVYYFAFTISTPITELSKIGKKIAEGDLTLEIPEMKTGDEVEELSTTMSMLVGAIKFLNSQLKDK